MARKSLRQSTASGVSRKYLPSQFSLPLFLLRGYSQKPFLDGEKKKKPKVKHFYTPSSSKQHHVIWNKFFVVKKQQAKLSWECLIINNIGKRGSKSFPIYLFRIFFAFFHKKLVLNKPHKRRMKGRSSFQKLTATFHESYRRVCKCFIDIHRCDLWMLKGNHYDSPHSRNLPPVRRDVTLRQARRRAK